MIQTTVNISHLQNPEWKAAESENYNTEITAVWRIAVHKLVPQINLLQQILHSNEIEKAIRFFLEADKQRFIISRAVLEILLSRYIGVEPEEIHFQYDKNKKPRLRDDFQSNLHFNISHSGNWILIAISRQEIGVDVEEMNASFTYQNLLPFGFSKEEKEFIENSARPNQNFYQLWTRKESLLKATGIGLVDELFRVPSLTGIHQSPIEIIGSAKNWQVISFPVDENHAGSVAFIPVKTALQFFNFEL